MNVRQSQLRAAIETMVRYLDLRRELRDWHGVRDAAADIEKLEAALAEVSDA